MATIEYLCCLSGFDPRMLSKEENWLLEAALLGCICDELALIFEEHNKFKENNMMHNNVINRILLDLLRSKDYTIEGVAAYSNVPEEVIYDIAIGNNSNPSLDVSRKIIELHKSARVDLYQKVMQKITATYQKTG